MRIFLYRLLALALFVLFPLLTFAFTYSNYKLIDTTENSLIISFGPFGTPQKYLCGLSDYSCVSTSTESFSKNVDIPTTTIEEWYSQNKSSVVYKTTERITQEAIAPYFLSAYASNSWTSPKQLSITDDILKIYWPESAQNEFSYLTKKNRHSTRDLVRFNATENMELSRKTISELITNGNISADGQWFAYYAPLNKNKKSTTLLHLQPLVVEYRYDYTVPKSLELLTEANRLMAFSPDSTRFAFLEDGSGAPVTRIVSLMATKSSLLSKAEIVGVSTINTTADLWFPNNDTLLLVGNDSKNTLDWYLYSYDIKTKKITPAISDVSYAYKMEQIGNQVILGKMSGPNLIPIAYDPILNQSHEFNLPQSIANPAIVSEVVRLKNGLNGVIVENKDMKITTKTPMVVWLHGGPFRQIAKGYHSYPSYAVYDWILDQLVLQGAVVIKIDYAGSYGYGNKVAYGVVNNVGKQDVNDVRNSVNEINKKLKFSGPVYLAGNSYGGYLGPRVLVAYLKEFSGAIAINGVFEWHTLLDYLQNSIFNTHLGGLYNTKKAQTYNQASITNRIKRLSKAQNIVIIHGMEDATINPDQSYTFYKLLNNAGKNTKIISIPEEGHIFKRYSSLETICKVSSEAIGFKVQGESCLFK